MFDTRFAVAAVAAVLIPAAAPACPMVTQAVSPAGLDLSSPAGQSALRTRIARAAKAVCGPANYTDVAMAQANACREAAARAAGAKAATLIARANAATQFAGRAVPPQF